jgi:hypothetical protein
MTGRIKRIHVNQHVIRANQRTGDRLAPLRVKTARGNGPAHEIVIEGPCRVVYRPDKPLSCGARVWIETTAPVVVFQDGESHSRFD